jgi:2-polyprenyl-6-methoxyphenol hydroxylase-like FAD-dependent oxidoreductase
VATAIECDCVIAGGGPAGMVLGLLLARKGLRVTVLERHADFFRDFRGDTIHPSTLTVLGELGLRDAFLELPVHRVSRLDVIINGQRIAPVDFRLLPPPDDFLVLAPQWDLLNFIARASAEHPGYDLRMSTPATGLLIEDGVVVGATADGPDGPLEIRAPLTIAADGRGSTLRPAAGFEPIGTGVPIDVLWFDLPVPAEAPANPTSETLFSIDANGFALTIPRGDHWQGGYVIPKGGFAALQAAGLGEFQRRFATTSPISASVIGTVDDWSKVKLLSVQIDRLPTWHRPGFMAIGDAAHAMSPVGGVGVNYAIQDAVALANAIVDPLSRRAPLDAALAAVQARRERPVARMQGIQRVIHDRMARAAVRHRSPVPRALLPLVRALVPLVRRRFTRLVGLGLLPEHVQD